MDLAQAGPLMTGISAVLSLVIVGLVFGWRKDKRETQEAKTKAQQALEEGQRKNRELTLALEREKRESAADLREQTAFEEERQARPSVQLIDGPRVEGGVSAYAFRIRNRGKVFADDVSIWMVNAWGQQLGEAQHVAQMIEPDDCADITLQIPEGAEPPVRVYTSWRDLTGLHQRESWVTVPGPTERGPASGHRT